MLETRNPVEVLTTLRTAERLLSEEADKLRRRAVNQADYGGWGPTQRYHELQDAAADLGQLAAEIATEGGTRKGLAGRRAPSIKRWYPVVPARFDLWWVLTRPGCVAASGPVSCRRERSDSESAPRPSKGGAHQSTWKRR